MCECVHMVLCYGRVSHGGGNFHLTLSIPGIASRSTVTTTRIKVVTRDELVTETVGHNSYKTDTGPLSLHEF